MTGIQRTLDRGFDKALSATGIVATALMLLLSILVFMLTLSRYVFRINLPGLFEGAVYSLIVFPFLSAAYTLKEKQHISVDILTSHLAGRTQVILGIATCALSLVYIGVLGWQGWRWTVNLLKYGALTDGVFRVPKGALAAVIVFGCFLLLLQIIREIIGNVRSLPQQPASTRRRDNPWLVLSLLAGGVLVSVWLFTYVSTTIGLIFLALVILFSGMPIFLALGLIGVAGIFFLLGTGSFLQAPITVYASMNSFPLTCLPLFILGGVIMEVSGITEDMFRFFELWTGRSVISPLLVTITVGMVFCAISGSSVATTAVVAAVAMPLLVQRGFSRTLSSGLVAGATVGSLIPPSIGYVIYGVITGESIAKLFMATLIPALILFALYYLYIILLAKLSRKSLFENGKEPVPESASKATRQEKLTSLKTALWGLATPVLIIGGIYLGIYTPTESAAVLVIYATIVATLVKRVNWREILKATQRSVTASAMILCIIFSAYIFSIVLSQMRVSANLVAYGQAIGMTAIGWLIIIFIVLAIAGMFIDSGAMKLIFLPVFYAPAMAAGINSLWLAVFWQFMSEIGLLTPPVGLNVFVIKGVSEVPLGTVFKGCLPFVLMMLLTLVIMYFFPQTVTWLPGTMK